MCEMQLRSLFHFGAKGTVENPILDHLALKGYERTAVSRIGFLMMSATQTLNDMIAIQIDPFFYSL
jgi:hypothetical protein